MGSKLKVAMVGNYPIRSGQIDGGVQAVTAYLVDAMRRLEDIEIHVVMFTSTVSCPTVVEEDGLVIHALPIKRFGVVTRHLADRTILDKVLEGIQPDIVHGQGVLREGFLAVKSKYPAVFTVHGVIREDSRYVSRLGERLRLFLESLICERYCVTHGQHAILISRYVSDYYGGRMGGETHLIANPIKETFFNLQRNRQPGRILFAGRLIPRKGVIDLLKAVAIARHEVDLHLTLAGSTSDSSYVEIVNRTIESLGIGDCVSIPGLLNEAEVLDEFSCCDILVLPSYQETAPMVIQQAMAAGIPVIATKICGVPYQVDHGETGLLFDPGDVDTLANHLVSVLGDEQLQGQMSARAKEKAVREYRASEVARKTVAVYKGILGRSPDSGDSS